MPTKNQLDKNVLIILLNSLIMSIYVGFGYANREKIWRIDITKDREKTTKNSKV